MMKKSTFPTFRTERLILREITEADAPSYEENFVTYDVISQLSKAVPWPYPKDGVLEWIKNEILPKNGKDKWVWGISLKDKPNEIIGVVELWKEGKPENRGFFLGKRFWGQGFMTEAVKPVTNYAFDVLGFEKLIFANALGNNRSRRIKEKTGARLIRLEPAKYVSPDYTQREVWELKKEEWYKLKGL
ncbi:MAG: GNAT family N-acetyltransferase [Rickettsiales bacterium]|nr:GNAT family N-acetyltransferase [Rickettsiales bacterium]